jgi:hypothetical protein
LERLRSARREDIGRFCWFVGASAPRPANDRDLQPVVLYNAVEGYDPPHWFMGAVAAGHRAVVALNTDVTGPHTVSVWFE